MKINITEIEDPVVYVYDHNNELVERYDTVTEAADFLNHEYPMRTERVCLNITLSEAGWREKRPAKEWEWERICQMGDGLEHGKVEVCKGVQRGQDHAPAPAEDPAPDDPADPTKAYRQNNPKPKGNL